MAWTEGGAGASGSELYGKLVVLERSAANILMGNTAADKGLEQLKCLSKELKAFGDSRVKIRPLENSLNNLIKAVSKLNDDMEKQERLIVNLSPLLTSSVQCVQEVAHQVVSLVKRVEALKKSKEAEKNLTIISEWIGLSQFQAVVGLLTKMGWSFHFLMGHLRDEDTKCDLQEGLDLWTQDYHRALSTELSSAGMDCRDWQAGSNVRIGCNNIGHTKARLTRFNVVKRYAEDRLLVTSHPDLSPGEKEAIDRMMVFACEAVVPGCLAQCSH